jgi:hypothetical protein
MTAEVTRTDPPGYGRGEPAAQKTSNAAPWSGSIHS